jgi:tetratricopeptide (TPR) repeat protein
MRRSIRRGVLLASLLFLAVDAAAQSGRIAGLVKNDRGQAIYGATVTASLAGSEAASLTTTTDEKGRFTMLGVRAGSWAFTAEAPGFVTRTLDVRIRPLPARSPQITLALKAVAPEGTPAVKDMQQALGNADYLYNSQRWDEAIAAYRQILADAPALSVVNLQLAAAYRNKRDFDRAISSYGEVLKGDPDNAKAKVGIAMANLEKGDLDSAERALEAAAQGEGGTREIFYNLGEVKLSKSKTGEAFAAYTRAAQIDPAWGRPLLALGRLAKYLGDLDGAAEYFQRVVDLDARSPEAAQAKAAIEQLRK